MSAIVTDLGASAGRIYVTSSAQARALSRPLIGRLARVSLGLSTEYGPSRIKKSVSPEPEALIVANLHGRLEVLGGVFGDVDGRNGADFQQSW